MAATNANPDGVPEINPNGPLVPESGAADKPSMGDPEFINGQVREMFAEASDALLAAEPGSNPADVIKAIALRYADQFYAGNDAYLQTFTPEAQFVWLQEHGLATEDDFDKHPEAAVTALVAETLKRLVHAITDHVHGNIDDEQLQFRIDTAVEDCASMLLGVDNPAD